MAIRCERELFFYYYRRLWKLSRDLDKWSWHGTTAAKPRAMSLLNGQGAKEEDRVNRRQAESHELAQWPRREGGRQSQPPSSFEAVDFVFFLLPRHSPSKLGPCSCFVRQLFIATDHYINVFKHVYRTVMISVTYRNPYRWARKRHFMTRPNDTDDTLIQYLLPFC